MALRMVSNSDDRARALRDHVLPILRERGSLLSQRDVVRVIELRLDDWIFRHWTPFNDLAPEEASSPGYRHAVARQHTRGPNSEDIDVVPLSHVQHERPEVDGRRLWDPFAFVPVKVQRGADEYIRHHSGGLRFLVSDLALVDGPAFGRLQLLR